MEISSGEYVGVCSIEITSIPDISIISSGYQDYTDIEKEYMNNFSSLASEVFQNYKYIISQNSNAEISMELLWVTEPVNNQPYKAKIRPFLVIRAISGDQSSAQAIIEQIYSLYESSLKLQKYGFEEIEFPRLTEIISGVQIEDSIAIVKDEREENLFYELAGEFLQDRIVIITERSSLDETRSRCEEVADWNLTMKNGKVGSI